MTLGRRPLPADLRARIYERDDWRCVAPKLGAEDACRDFSGHIIVWPPRSGIVGYIAHCLTLDHVKDQPMLGKRAPDDAEHLATLCWHHHLEGWATAHRPELRTYLAEVNAKEPAE
jgi:hypothetical protein